MHHLLFYDYVADMVERRTPYREEHLRLAREAASRGELLLAGALADPIDGAVLVFSSESPATVERFVAGDPYVRAGLVTAWRIRRGQVVGDASAEPAA